MDKKFKAKIIQALRKLSWSWAARKSAMKKQQRGSQLYECEICSRLVYSGTSERNYNAFRLLHPDVKMEKISLDHKIPCLDPTKGFEDWNTYIERLFCTESNFQVLCKTCHDKKTAGERALVSKHRKLNEFEEY